MEVTNSRCISFRCYWLPLLAPGFAEGRGWAHERKSQKLAGWCDRQARERT